MPRFAQNRDIIGSDLTIIGVIFFHVGEAVIFLTTNVANGAIGMAALLDVFHSPPIAAAALLIASISACVGQWMVGLDGMTRFKLLLPQQFLLLVTAFGALGAVFAGAYADGVARSWMFILCDQVPRLVMPALYSAAISARVAPRNE